MCFEAERHGQLGIIVVLGSHALVLHLGFGPGPWKSVCEFVSDGVYPAFALTDEDQFSADRCASRLLTKELVHFGIRNNGNDPIETTDLREPRVQMVDDRQPRLILHRSGGLDERLLPDE